MFTKPLPAYKNERIQLRAESMDEEKSLVGELVKGVGHLAPPVETALLKTLWHLLGGVAAWPASLIRRKVQAAEDITNARSLVSAMLAKGVGENALNDPLVMKAAAEIYLPVAIRKSENLVQVAQSAANHVAEDDGNQTNAAPPDLDWMNIFTRYAEDASSEKLQDLFARILAGEVVRPGSFSPATLRAVAELDKATAEDFSLMWARDVGGSIDSAPDLERGEWFSRWMRLIEAGLMASDTTLQHPPEQDSSPLPFVTWSPMMRGNTFILVYVPRGAAPMWKHISFTRVGRELGSILARPDYLANMKAAGAALGVRTGLQVDLFSEGKRIEQLTPVNEVQRQR